MAFCAACTCSLLKKNFLICAGGLSVGGAAYYMMYQRRLAEERRLAVAAVNELNEHDFENLRSKYDSKSDSVPAATKRKR